MGLFDFLFKKKDTPKTSMRNKTLSLSDRNWEQEDKKLREEAMRRSEEYSQRHQRQLEQIDLSKIRYNHLIDTTLSPVEIIFLDYLNGLSIDNPNIAGYWTHDYQVDFQAVLEKYFVGGYLKESDYKFNMTKCKTPELKDFLKDRALKTSGKKDDLVARIIHECPENELYNHFNKSFFQHTDKAIELLAQNDHLIYFHKHRNDLGISIQEAVRIKSQSPKLDKYRIAMRILDSRLKKHKRKKDWGLYRNDIFAMSIVYHNEKDYLKELALLFEVCYWDLSGYGNNGTIDPSLAFLAPGIISRIISIIDNLNLNESKLKDMYIESISKIEINHRLSFVETYNILKKELGI